MSYFLPLISFVSFSPFCILNLKIINTFKKKNRVSKFATFPVWVSDIIRVSWLAKSYVKDKGNTDSCKIGYSTKVELYGSVLQKKGEDHRQKQHNR